MDTKRSELEERIDKEPTDTDAITSLRMMGSISHLGHTRFQVIIHDSDPECSLVSFSSAADARKLPSPPIGCELEPYIFGEGGEVRWGWFTWLYSLSDLLSVLEGDPDFIFALHASYTYDGTEPAVPVLQILLAPLKKEKSC